MQLGVTKRKKITRDWDKVGFRRPLNRNPVYVDKEWLVAKRKS